MMRRTHRAVWVIAATIGIVGHAASALAGTVTGTVRFEGTPPPRKPVAFGGEKQCALMHKDQLLKEDVVVNDNGTVKWALVYVKDGLPAEAAAATAPTEPVVIDQAGCWFAPHVAVAMVGQPVEFRNGDPVLHNVRAASKQAQGFNIAQPVQGMKSTKKFTKPELGVLLRCDVHFWMASYLHVLPHPYFVVTGDDGTFAIAGLPAGTYTLELWHETLGPRTQTVTVGDGDAVADFTLATP